VMRVAGLAPAQSSPFLPQLAGADPQWRLTLSGQQQDDRELSAVGATGRPIAAAQGSNLTESAPKS